MGTPSEVTHCSNEEPVNKMLALFARALPSKILWASCIRFHNVQAEHVNWQLRQAPPPVRWSGGGGGGWGGVVECFAPAKTIITLLQRAC